MGGFTGARHYACAYACVQPAVERHGGKLRQHLQRRLREFELINLCLSLRDVGDLPTGEDKSRELAQSFETCMDLGGQPASRTSQSLPLFLGAPAAC